MIALRTDIPGPKSQALRKREDDLLAPGLQNFAILAGIVVDKASGSLITDIDGNRFIDFIGGIGVNGLGHSHPDYVKALKAQLDRISVGSFTSEARVEFLEAFEKHHPVAGEYAVQLYSSGAEAVESALRLAKSYTQKYEIAGFWGGFHGKTTGVLPLLGSSGKNGLGPTPPGYHSIPYASCYRCPSDRTYPDCDIHCATLASRQLKMQSLDQIAALIVEPMQGTAGNIIPPKEFLPKVRQLADEKGALLICDEMITGFGRTGKFWGWEHSGANPDIITFGKQFAGGFPMSGVLAKKEIAQAKPWANPSGSSSSYGGNPLACAAANAALKIIENEDLVDNSKNMGEYLLSKLIPFKDRFEIVGEVRGLGLLVGIEMVENKQSRKPLSKSRCQQIFQRCLQKGLLTMAYAPNFRIQPSMNVDKETIDEAIQVLEEVFETLS